MARARKSWSEKLKGGKNMPKTLEFDPRFPCGKALQKKGAKPGDSVVLAPGTEVEEVMRSVPLGKLITIDEICERLAEKHSTKYCCTLTTGIFIMIAAHAAEEERAKGGIATPYWRTVKAGGFLNEKYPGGTEAQRLALESEGFCVLMKGKKLCVKDYKEFLIA
jgi:hypothetical protein